MRVRVTQRLTALAFASYLFGTVLCMFSINYSILDLLALQFRHGRSRISLPKQNPGAPNHKIVGIFGLASAQPPQEELALEGDVIIGMFDTGIWLDSPSFSDEDFGPPPSKWKGVCQNFTCNKYAKYTFNSGFIKNIKNLN